METNLGIFFIIKNFFPGQFGLVNDYEAVLLRFFPWPFPLPKVCKWLLNSTQSVATSRILLENIFFLKYLILEVSKNIQTDQNKIKRTAFPMYY